jgi:Cu(I)/Ag(I) efflux system protein CusF
MIHFLNTLRALLRAAVLAAAAATLAPHALAAGSTPPAVAAPMTPGEVRKIDPEHGRITLQHGAIKNLDMPPMTMVFQVRDRALLDKVQVGDKVVFAAANDNGKLTVTQIQPAR